MLSEDMPLPAMLGVDTLVSVLAVDVVTNLRGPRAAMPALQGAHVIGMAAVTGAVTGEVVTGEAITGIRPMDILGSAITVWAMAIHTTGMSIRYGYGYGYYGYYPYRYGYWPSVTFSFGY